MDALPDGDVQGLLDRLVADVATLRSKRADLKIELLLQQIPHLRSPVAELLDSSNTYRLEIALTGARFTRLWGLLWGCCFTMVTSHVADEKRKREIERRRLELVEDYIWERRAQQTPRAVEVNCRR
jgi:hypothetical protein